MASEEKPDPNEPAWLEALHAAGAEDALAKPGTIIRVPKLGDGHELALPDCRPYCARCDNPVQHFTCKRDPRNGDVLFTATCHGQTEVVRVKDYELRGLKQLTLRFAGDAFCAHADKHKRRRLPR